MLKMLDKYSDWSVILVRLALGLVFFTHGIGKLLNIGPYPGGIEGAANFLAGLGVPAALFFAWVIALVETFGSLALLGGLFVRYAALLLSIEMVVAILLVHLPKGWSIFNNGYEYPLVLLLLLVSMLLSGAGKKYNLEKILFKKEI